MSRAVALASSRGQVLRGTCHALRSLQSMLERRLLHWIGATVRLSRGLDDFRAVPVLVPRMVCFCFGRNKVSPIKQIELPDISAIPESSGTSAVPENSAVSGNSASPESSAAEGGPAVLEDSALEQSSSGPENSAVNESSVGPKEFPAGGSSASSAVPVNGSTSTARNSCDDTADGATTETVSEVVQTPVLQESPSSADLFNVCDFTKRTFGRFDVFFASGDGADSDVTAASGRPLVILIPWLNARRRHVHKYSSLYLEKGMDVLHMQLTPMQIVRPLRTKEVVGQLLHLLKKEGSLADRPLIIHGFSIGAFVWGQILVEMTKTNDARDSDSKPLSNSSSEDSVTTGDSSDVHDNFSSRESEGNTDDTVNGDSATADQSSSRAGEAAQQTSNTCSQFSDVHERIIGVVMDSPAPVEAMLDGIPNSISSKAIVRAAIRAFLSSYFRLFPESVASHYMQGEAAAEKNPYGLPVLMLYSSADLIAPVRKLEAVVESWEKRGLVVYVRKWDDSPHVGHFRCHPEQYKEELYLFLDRLCLTGDKV